jgi:hypothetical protein
MVPALWERIMRKSVLVLDPRGRPRPLPPIASTRELFASSVPHSSLRLRERTPAGLLLDDSPYRKRKFATRESSWGGYIRVATVAAGRVN